MPHVSICIPTYNNPEDVERLLDSIEKQTYKDVEIIITDDSTDDRTEKLVERYSLPIDYHHNEKPLGHIFNWNEALKYAKADLVKIMFSDDWFTFDDSLEKMVRLLDEDPDASLCFSGSRQVKLDEEGTPHRDRYAGDEYIEKLRDDHRILFMSNQIGAPSATLYRRDKAICFDEKSNWASDVFLYFEILNRNKRFVYSREPLISIGEHSNQYTESFGSHDPRIFFDYRYMYRKYDLKDSDECRHYYKEEFLIPFVKERLKAPWRKLRNRLKNTR